MNEAVAYLDASAIVKLIVDEPNSAALREWLRTRPVRASAALSRTEVVRAVRRIGPDAVARARDGIRDLRLIQIDDRLLDSAGTLDPQVLRSLDAIHLAAALSLGDDLLAIVSYDDRMLDGARLLGLPAVRPV